MADNQLEKVSTVAPSDSISASGKKSKPGKAERLARRAATGSTPGSQASLSKAMTFAAGAQTPKPQPGKFPVVFQTGAGEPSRDKFFVVNERVLGDTLSEFPKRFTFNARYNEFKAHAEIEDHEFARDLKVASLLRLAQQLVHSHVNMGLPQGDFAPVASNEVKIPASLNAYLSQFGEHSVPALGTRFLLRDYPSQVNAIIWAARCVAQETGRNNPISRSWLPVEQADPRTRAILASRLNIFLAGVNLWIDDDELETRLLSGEAPEVWEDLKGQFGDTDATRDRFDFLFKSYPDVAQFATAFTTASASGVLRELGLVWENPLAGHLSWDFRPKVLFTELSDEWARKSATYAHFFELASSQSNRSVACGSQAQMAEVRTDDSVTVVKTHLALSAPEFSLVACFPASARYSGDLERRVVVTTPLSVTQRATEFVQMDWR